jgi:NAD(P)-dependent dehydrogenase (short-subunit alcohol dehydrogenase family)
MKLAGKVAIVTGASRGIGKGIAKELGKAGATVVVTGRSVEPGSHRLGGTIAETARLVDEAGGRGIARRVDHGDDEQVRALVEGVHAELGRIDLLVNNVFTVPEAREPGEQPFGPFWQAPIWAWDAMLQVGLRCHYVASCYAAPFMVAARSGLIVNISSWGGKHFFGSVAYCVGKTGVDRLAETMAHDLREHDVAAVSLYPGTVRTERMVEAAKTHGAPFDLYQAESPELTGRAVVALAADPRIMEQTGKVLVVAQLARDYGFTEDDGSLPPVGV